MSLRILPSSHNQMIVSPEFCFSSKPIKTTYQFVNFGIPTVDYEKVKRAYKNLSNLLIDVRTPEEHECGRIPNSVNIPLSRIEIEMDPQFPAKEFMKKYKRNKPDVDTYIIVYCRSGRRAEAASEILKELGYRNVYRYPGSWLEWAERECCP